MSSKQYVIVDYSSEKLVVSIGTKEQLQKELEQLKNNVRNSPLTHPDRYDIMSADLFNTMFGHRYSLNDFTKS